MTTGPRNRSPDEWEREIERTRDDLGRTLGALRARVSRGALVDRMMRSMRDEGGDFAAGIGRAIRDNPVPATMVGFGLAWLLMASRSGNGAYRVIKADAAFRRDPHRPPAGRAARVTPRAATAEIVEPAPADALESGAVENGHWATPAGGI
jgi:hypothetical protein